MGIRLIYISKDVCLFPTGVVPSSLGLHSLQPSPVAPDSQAQSPTQLQYRNKVQHRRFSMEVSPV